MLSKYHNITLSAEIQAYVLKGIEKISDEEYRSTLTSIQKTGAVRCPECRGRVHIHDSAHMELKSYPLAPGVMHIIDVFYHRYKCMECGKTFAEDIPNKRHNTRITEEAATFITDLLKHGMTIKAVQKITGVHWDTIRTIHKETMDTAIAVYEEKEARENYKPKHLAVDEFAIHKGHSYATCVMDLDTGHVLWVGKGRSKEDFEEFFKAVPESYLSEVKAFAMDMNASYNLLVSKHLPKVEIVYDRYHMQAQFGRDVLGVVRLNEARKHRDEAKEIEKSIPDDATIALKTEMKLQAREQRKQYSVLKKSRWTILRNSENLTEDVQTALKDILDKHGDLAVCYAMKEQMCDLFDLTDSAAALNKWNEWFDAAEQSGIEPLIKFAKQKRKRLLGLVAHAKYAISTGPLEGLNNKIKVAKRTAYGYRDDEFFFTLIRFITIPST